MPKYGKVKVVKIPMEDEGYAVPKALTDRECLTVDAFVGKKTVSELYEEIKQKCEK